VRPTKTTSTTIEHTVLVHRSVEDTWRVLTDFNNMPKWARGVAEIVAISPGPLAVGTTVTDVGLGLKRHWRETFSVEELVPNQVLGLVWRGSYGAAHVRYTLQVAPQGTLLTGATYGDYRFPFWIILTFMSNTANRNFRAGLENIKKLAEMQS
jgi:hypothetical protein